MINRIRKALEAGGLELICPGKKEPRGSWFCIRERFPQEVVLGRGKPSSFGSQAIRLFPNDSRSSQCVSLAIPDWADGRSGPDYELVLRRYKDD